MSAISKILSALKGLFRIFRPGLEVFLEKYKDAALEEMLELAAANPGTGLHVWWDQAFARIKNMVIADIGYVRDNWVAILVNITYEIILAKKVR